MGRSRVFVCGAIPPLSSAEGFFFARTLRRRHLFQIAHGERRFFYLKLIVRIVRTYP